jgi:Transposase IS66 family
VFYRYAPDRKALQADALLRGCRGFMHADAYSGFRNLYEPDTPMGQAALIEVACWAHARRKIYEVFAATASPAAHRLLEMIATLFAIEESIKGRPPVERAATRQELAVPLLAELKAMFESTLSRISGKSSLAQAIRYALPRWRLAGLATILPETVAQEQRGLCVVRLKPAIDSRRVALLQRRGGYRSAASRAFVTVAQDYSKAIQD